MTDCRTCKGAGTISRSPYNNGRPYDPQAERIFTCPRCLGTGVEPEKKP